MVLALAAGQFLDASGPRAIDIESSLRIARLKSSAYTVEAPLAIGSALAGGTAGVESCLAAYARSLGEAFQLRDDLDDGDAAPGVGRSDVVARVDAACAALDGSVAEDAAEGLRALALGIGKGA